MEVKEKINSDIIFLKRRLVFLIKTEKYELANRIKNWIIELGGDPTIEF